VLRWHRRLLTRRCADASTGVRGGPDCYRSCASSFCGQVPGRDRRSARGRQWSSTAARDVQRRLAVERADDGNREVHALGRYARLVGRSRGRARRRPREFLRPRRTLPDARAGDSEDPGATSGSWVSCASLAWPSRRVRSATSWSRPAFRRRHSATRSRGEASCKRTAVDSRLRLLHGRHGLAAPPLRARLPVRREPPHRALRLHRQAIHDMDAAAGTQRADGARRPGRQVRFLIQDRDAKFPPAFDALHGSEQIKIIRTPVQAPNANAHMERWVGSVRCDCLDRRLILGRTNSNTFSVSTSGTTTAGDPLRTRPETARPRELAHPSERPRPRRLFR
jgi:hypothetical protein